MDYSVGDLMKTHHYNTGSCFHSRWFTRKPFIKLTTAILLLCISLTHTKDLSPCFSFERLLDTDIPIKIPNITLGYNSGKPLEVLCSLFYHYEKTRELFSGYDKPIPEPSSRIAFFNFTKRIDSKYVFINGKYSAKLVIPNPPLYIGKIYCVLLMDDYQKSLAYDIPIEASTVHPWYMPQIFPGLGIFICVTDLFVIPHEYIDLKINVVSISDTTIDIKLKLPRVIYSDPYFVVNYNIMQNETQSLNPKTLVHRFIIMSRTMFQLVNLETNKTYHISVKLCNILDMKEYCTNFTTPISVRTGLMNIMKTVDTISTIYPVKAVDTMITMNPMTTFNAVTKMDPMKKSASIVDEPAVMVDLIKYKDPLNNPDPNAQIFYGFVLNKVNRVE